jgi:hypothetical protein
VVASILSEYLANLNTRAALRGIIRVMKGRPPSRYNRRRLRRTLFACFAAWMLPAATSGAAQEGISVTELLKTGWEIAGYSQAFDKRSTVILFRH